jgi:hypothetical protein
MWWMNWSEEGQLLNNLMTFMSALKGMNVNLVCINPKPSGKDGSQYGCLARKK